MGAPRKAQSAKIITLDRSEYKRLAALTFNLEQRHLLDHSKLVYSAVLKRMLDKLKVPSDPEEISRTKFVV